MTEHMRPAAQLDVQRALGRCMLSLQQDEHLLKALLAQHERTGSIDTLDAEQAARRDRLANLTLGSLVKVLFETVVVPEGFERGGLATLGSAARSSASTMSSCASGSTAWMPAARRRRTSSGFR